MQTTSTTHSTVDVSVVIPVLNERDNLRPLFDAVDGILACLGRSYEIIFVDDGSTDGSLDVLRALAAQGDGVTVVEFRRNFGQTAALCAGFEQSRGDVIVTLDADGQNDPADIPALLAKLDEGYDLVHGWRRHRRDPFFSRTLPSRVANAIISRATGFPVHDLGCSLKAMRREIALELRLYGEMHRFIPILAHWRGARCVEVVTNHRPRQSGASKYGMSRVVRVLLDLVTVEYLIRYLVSPMRFFGAIGLACGAVGFLAGIATVWMKLAHGTDLTGNPLLLLTVFSMTVGVQFFGLGLLAELGARIYFELQDRSPHAIRHVRKPVAGDPTHCSPATIENDSPLEPAA